MFFLQGGKQVGWKDGRGKVEGGYDKTLYTRQKPSFEEKTRFSPYALHFLFI